MYSFILASLLPSLLSFPFLFLRYPLSYWLSSPIFVIFSIFLFSSFLLFGLSSSLCLTSFHHLLSSFLSFHYTFSLLFTLSFQLLYFHFLMYFSHFGFSLSQLPAFSLSVLTFPYFFASPLVSGVFISVFSSNPIFLVTIIAFFPSLSSLYSPLFSQMNFFSSNIFILARLLILLLSSPHPFPFL